MASSSEHVSIFCKKKAPPFPCPQRFWPNLALNEDTGLGEQHPLALQANALSRAQPAQLCVVALYMPIKQTKEKPTPQKTRLSKCSLM